MFFIIDGDGRCHFCEREAERRLWVRRWAVREGRRRGEGVADVRVAVCRAHLRLRVIRRRLLVKEGWAYG